MNVCNFRLMLLPAMLLLVSLLPARLGHATIVEFQTSLGNFEVNLADNSTPQTVANFLEYVNNGRYTNSIIHRSVSDFVVQGGGFVFDQALPLNSVPEFSPVVNEPVFSSTRGTIAMAKLGGDPNSATSQWFFNLSDNSAQLDDQNGGFTVFGQVVGNGMDVVDAIAAVPTFAFASPLTDLPLRDYTSTDFASGVEFDSSNLVVISAVVVTDSTVDTSAGLSLVSTTQTTAPPITLPVDSGGGGGGGVGFLAMLIMLAANGVRRAKLNRR